VEVFVLRVFPLLLAVGALGLAIWELKNQPVRPLRFRLARRLGGSLVLFCIAVAMWTGQLPNSEIAQKSPDQALAMLQHWVSVFALVCLLIVLALWDTWAGMRNLRGYFDEVEKDELGKIQEHLHKPPAGPSFIDEPGSK
jgi:uncharacterized membrane protein YcjF (UPF0283 family)